MRYTKSVNMNKILKKICIANGISLDDADAERKAMDLLTGNDEESAVHESEADYHYLCGNCDGFIESTVKPNMWGHIMCPHCKIPNIPQKP